MIKKTPNPVQMSQISPKGWQITWGISSQIQDNRQMTPHATDSLGSHIVEKDRKTSENDTFVVFCYGFVLIFTKFD